MPKPSTIAEEGTMSTPQNPTDHGVPIHPGELLRNDFLAPMGLSSNALAIALRVPVTRITEIVRERRGITADTALRLARYFGTTPDFWMKMQLSYDLALASSQVAVRIQAEVIPAALALKQGSNENSSQRKRLRETA
jgi:antitoxin HigA-1